MKERPILFSAPMVQAILEGRKTQTRRVLKDPLDKTGGQYCVEHADDDPNVLVHVHNPKCGGYCDYACSYPCPYGQPGDRLWVRETFRLHDSGLCGCGSDRCFCPADGTPIYRCTVNPDLHPAVDEEFRPWRPSIFMPRWASRINLEITDIRVERLQSLSEADALAEGLGDGDQFETHLDEWKFLWTAINGLGSWLANPWVWVVEFEKLEVPHD